MSIQPKPVAVVISDIHFNLQNLSLASKALNKAILKAETMEIPLIIAGDLNDTKAIIRAEVANELITILKDRKCLIYIIEGNHDKINEKGIGHGLNYLAPYAIIVDKPKYIDNGIILLPYYSDSEELKNEVQTIKDGNIIIMHQGIRGAWMGDYIQDKSSIDPEVFKDFKVISGHYHKHQTVGTVTYIGSPYTITYGEAKDGPKGFLILSSDSTYERVILNLRKHIIVERHIDNALDPVENYTLGDLLWIKVKGSKLELSKLNKKDFKYQNFKLDLIPDDVQKSIPQQEKHWPDSAKFDNLIDSLNESDIYKQSIKSYWRYINENT